MSPSGNLISHLFRENDICRDVEWERYFCYKSIEIADIYSGPNLTFPMTFSNAAELVEAFQNHQVGTTTHSMAVALALSQMGLTELTYVTTSTPRQRIPYWSTYLCFFLVAAPFSIRPSASWGNLEASSNPPQHKSGLHLQKQGDYHLWWGEQ